MEYLRDRGVRERFPRRSDHRILGLRPLFGGIHEKTACELLIERDYRVGRAICCAAAKKYSPGLICIKAPCFSNREACVMVAPALEDLKIASHVAVFDGLKPDVVSRLLAAATMLTLNQGDCLYRQGDLAASLHIVIAGWMKLYRITLSGDEAIIHVLTKGESLPEAAALTSARYAATAEAISKVRVLQIPADYLVRCIREMPDIAIAMIASSSRRMQRLVQEIEHLKAQTGIQRVAEFLASLCPPGAGPHVITLPYDKTLIAGHLGLKPESLSRAFAKLRSIGVNINASHVVVREVSKLKCLATAERVAVGPALTHKH